MKIMLILPHDSTYRHKKGTFNRFLLYPPVTLTTLAGLVPPELNADIRIIDEGVQSLDDDLKADLVGISTVTATVNRAYALADRIRKQGIPVVLGGTHPTVMPNEAIEHADAVVIGLAEESWPSLLRDFVAGRLQKFYHPGERIPFEGLPFPRRDLLKKRSYLTVNTLMATRGCPNRCTFCSIPVPMEGKYYQRPVGDVIGEIRAMKARNLIFLDANPNEDVEYAMELYSALVPLKIKWAGLTTTKLMRNDQLFGLAVKSGCTGLLFGFESISEQALCQSNKSFNSVAEYKTMIDKLHRNKIGVLGCFMFGFDADDKSIFSRTRAFIADSGIDLVRYTIFTPFPGTQIFADYNAAGRIIDHDWDHYDYEHVVFRPAQMTPDELRKGVDWIWKDTYSVKAICSRLIKTNPALWRVALYNAGFRHHACRLGSSVSN